MEELAPILTKFGPSGLLTLALVGCVKYMISRLTKLEGKHAESLEKAIHALEAGYAELKASIRGMLAAQTSTNTLLRTHQEELKLHREEMRQTKVAVTHMQAQLAQLIPLVKSNEDLAQKFLNYVHRQAKGEPVAEARDPRDLKKTGEGK